MFEVVRHLYGLDIRAVEGAEVWHPDVRFYEIHDAAGELRGRFYLDLYARANKRGGAWMDDCIARKRTRDGVQVPVAYLVCNFSPPLAGQPALFTHNEVTTLFHEFGHGLHHMLTRVDHVGVAGINGVAWDAVELAEPVHGELVLGARGVRPGCRAPCQRCNTAGRPVPENAGGQEFPVGHAVRAPARVRAFRYALARQF